jgi:hypothetical protein
MLINEIVEYCNNKYRNADTTNVCKNCKHPTNCSGNCKNCLEQIHYPSRFPQGKKDYDCDNLINFYVCDYTNKYASEMLYLLRESEKLKEIDEYHILSIGCGAAPDLMAFEKYAYETDSDKNIFYSGVDVNPRWEEIHDRIIGYNSDIINNIEFKYIDAINYFNENVLPGINVIVLQYVISHFYNTGQIYIIHQFFSDLIKNVVKVRKDDDPFVILINDVNSCNRGRDYFEILVEILKKNNYHGQCNCFYFDYKIQNDCQRYGNKHPRNNTLFELDNLDLDFYKPWEKCSSAQMLIEIE